MGTPPLADRAATDLSAALTRVAANPGQAAHLHQLLGEYCHECRNLLNCFKMSLYIASRERGPEGLADWSEITARYRDVERFIDRLQCIFRPMPLALARLSLDLLFHDRKGAWADLLAARGKQLLFAAPAVAPVGDYDPNRLVLGFDSLVEWRARLGGEGVDLRVRWEARNGDFRVVWDEPAREPTVPSSRSASSEENSVDSLTIPLLTRIISLHGGALRVSRSPKWRMDLRWPRNAQTSER